MRRERWLILAFIPALMLLNAFVVLNYTGLSYEPFSWKAFAQAYPPGTGCDPGPCDPGLFCVDHVCCTTPCDGPNETCNPDGICINTAPVPALSGTGLLIAALFLAGVGTIGLARNRRRS